MATLKDPWIQGLTSGMDQATNPALVARNESPNLKNVTLALPGVWATRTGTTAFGTQVSATDEGQGLFAYVATSGVNTLIAIADRDATALTEPGTWNDIDTDEWPAATRVDGLTS